MIEMIRVDDRLLHGQVAYSWKAKLNYEAIVIASNSVFEDEFRKSAIKMCVPNDVKLAIRNIEDASKLLNDERIKKMKVLVILEKIEDILSVYENIFEKPLLNIGGLASKENAYLISKGTYITKEEEKILSKLKNKGIKIEFQLVPNDEKKEY